MNQQLSDWASIAEIISGVAVVATLIFLVIGINENTNVTRALVYADTLDGLNEFESNINQNADLSRIWRAFIDGETTTLEALDRSRLISILTTMFRNYEKAYFTSQYDLLGESEWDRFERLICINFGRIEPIDMVETVTSILTDDFAAYIAQSCVE